MDSYTEEYHIGLKRIRKLIGQIKKYTGQGGWGAGSSREGPCRAQNTLGSVDKTEKKTLRSLQIKR